MFVVDLVPANSTPFPMQTSNKVFSQSMHCTGPWMKLFTLVSEMLACSLLSIIRETALWLIFCSSFFSRAISSSMPSRSSRMARLHLSQSIHPQIHKEKQKKGQNNISLNQVQGLFFQSQTGR